MNTVLEFASIPRNRDMWNIGMRRVNKIIEEERQLGLRAIPTGMYSDTVDILVFDNDQLTKVYEVTNWGSPEYFLQPDRAARYRNNLLQYPSSVRKIFVCSYEENLSTVGGKSYFEQHGIKVRVMGYQD